MLRWLLLVVLGVCRTEAACRLGSQRILVHSTEGIQWTQTIHVPTIKACIASCYLDSCSMLEWIPASGGAGNGECRRLLGPQKCIDGVAVELDRSHAERLVLQCFQCLRVSPDLQSVDFPVRRISSPFQDKRSRQVGKIDEAGFVDNAGKSGGNGMETSQILLNLIDTSKGESKKFRGPCRMTFQLADDIQGVDWTDSRALPTLRLCIMSCFLDQCELLHWVPPAHNGTTGECKRRFGGDQCKTDGITLNDYSEGSKVALKCIQCDTYDAKTPLLGRQNRDLLEGPEATTTVEPAEPEEPEDDDECKVLSWHAHPILVRNPARLLLLTHNVSDATRCAMLCYNLIGCDSVEYVPRSRDEEQAMCALYAPLHPGPRPEGDCSSEIRQIKYDEDLPVRLDCISCEISPKKIENMMHEKTVVSSRDKGCILSSFAITQAASIQHLASYSIGAQVPNAQVCAQLCLAQYDCDVAILVPPLNPANSFEQPGCYTLNTRGWPSEQRVEEQTCRNESARFVNYVHLSHMQLDCIHCEYSNEQALTDMAAKDASKKRALGAGDEDKLQQQGIAAADQFIAEPHTVTPAAVQVQTFAPAEELRPDNAANATLVANETLAVNGTDQSLYDELGELIDDIGEVDELLLLNATALAAANATLTALEQLLLNETLLLLDNATLLDGNVSLADADYDLLLNLTSLNELANAANATLGNETVSAGLNATDVNATESDPQVKVLSAGNLLDVLTSMAEEDTVNLVPIKSHVTPPQGVKQWEYLYDDDDEATKDGCDNGLTFEAAPAFLIFEAVLQSSHTGAANCARLCYDHPMCHSAMWQKHWGLFPKCLLLSSGASGRECAGYPRLARISHVDDSTPIRLQCIECAA